MHTHRLGFTLHLCALLAATAVLAPAQGGAAQSAGNFDPALYAELLERYTRPVPDTAGTRVDYRGLLNEPRWSRLVAQLRRSRPSQLRTRAERLAFWINAYNILSIETVLRGYPVESIRDLGSFLRPVWKRGAGRIGGRPVTLHHIEHEVLRPMAEPRIHAALVCASTSCPSLRREPYEAERIDEQLDDAVRRFLADPRKGLRIDRHARRVWLSRIFGWFDEDFEAAGGPLVWIDPYLPAADRAWLAANRSRVEVVYLRYDWRVNAL